MISGAPSKSRTYKSRRGTSAGGGGGGGGGTTIKSGWMNPNWCGIHGISCGWTNLACGNGANSRTWFGKHGMIGTCGGGKFPRTCGTGTNLAGGGRKGLPDDLKSSWRHISLFSKEGKSRENLVLFLVKIHGAIESVVDLVLPYEPALASKQAIVREMQESQFPIGQASGKRKRFLHAIYMEFHGFTGDFLLDFDFNEDFQASKHDFNVCLLIGFKRLLNWLNF